MRSAWLGLLLVSLIGCGTGDATEDAATTSAADATGGYGRECTADEAAADLAALTAQPITPNHIAGFNLTGGKLMLPDAMAARCAMNPAYHLDVTGTDEQGGWGTGDSATVTLGWDGFGGTVSYVQVRAGYTGTLSLAASGHSYVIAIGKPILRDGQAWAFDWSPAAANELYAAITTTFASSAAACGDDCELEPDDGTFGVRSLGLYVRIDGGLVDLIYAFPSAPPARDEE